MLQHADAIALLVKNAVETSLTFKLLGSCRLFATSAGEAWLAIAGMYLTTVRVGHMHLLKSCKCMIAT